MMNRAKIITARRAYEYAPDDLRLTSLSVGDVPDQIQRHFAFRGGSIATPPETFAAVPVTMPPGLVFNVGNVRSSSRQVPAPIRFLHFESQRIVIDVAGPSDALDEAFEQLNELLKDVKAPDGSPAVGEPRSTRDYSEVSVHLRADFNQMLSEPLSTAFLQTFANKEDDIEAVPVSLVIRVGHPSSTIDQPNYGQAILQIRAGTRVDEKILFSSSDLPSDENLAWVERLDAAISQP